jgi:predicted alpha/beta hydrolase family esterase
MGSAALTLANHSFVTLGDRSRSTWAALPEWAGARRTHIDYRVRTPAERNLLAAKLDQAVLRAEGPVLLLAQGASCFATAWWARLSPASYVSRVAGALLLDPVEGSGKRVGRLLDIFASPRIALPFPSIVLGGDAGRSELLPRLRGLAEGWGSGVDADDAEGPLNRTRRAIAWLTSGVVEQKVRTAHALAGRPLTAMRDRG